MGKNAPCSDPGQTCVRAAPERASPHPSGSGPVTKTGMVLTLPFVFAVMGSVLGLGVALLALLFSRVPGWEDQRRFAAIALTASLVTASNVTATLEAPGWLMVLLTRLQFATISVHIIAWLWYAAGFERRRPEWLERAAMAWNGLCVGLALIPGLVFSDSIRTHTILTWTYRDVQPTSFGLACFVVTALTGLLVIRRFWLAWRAGLPFSRLHLAMPCLMLAFAAHDVLVTTGVFRSIYLFDAVFLAPLLVGAIALIGRFTAEASELDRLRRSLEQQVAERSQELAHAQEALLRAEKLAALGQLSAGVAHEVNNPASVVAANLGFVLAEAGSGLESEHRAALVDAQRAIERITSIVRQLLDAGRLAASSEAPESVQLAAVVDDAVALSRTACGPVVPVASVPRDLWVVGRATPLVQVFVNLLANAAQAMPAGRLAEGRVAVTVERAAGRVRVRVVDNGVGLSAEVLRRAFEPFFTTKPYGKGTGLGLAISRGLLLSLGGDLQLAGNADGHGATAIVDLLEGLPPPK